MIIKRVAPFSCAKVVGAIYAIFWLLIVCMSTIVSLISAIVRISTGGSGPPISGVGFPIGIILPILYGVGVFLTALVAAWLYNTLAGVLGGIEVEVE
jgi:hypothetical protein